MPNEVTDQRPTLAFETDLLVVGGGVAGLAAAVTAARAGLRVILLERYGFCGGAAVAGLSGTVCGLYAASEDAHRPPEQLVFGFAEEFVALLRSRGGITDPIRPHQRIVDQRECLAVAPAAAFRPSTRRWHRPELPRRASPTARRWAWLPPWRCVPA